MLISLNSCSIKRMDCHTDEAILKLADNVQVDAQGIRVLNAGFDRIFNHAPLPRFYMARPIYLSNQVVIMNVGDLVSYVSCKSFNEIQVAVDDFQST